MPYLLARRDMMIQSRTGSGKTGAYLLPILAKVDPARPITQALILVPTRELAQQVAAEAEALGRETGVRTHRRLRRRRLRPAARRAQGRRAPRRRHARAASSITSCGARSRSTTSIT